MENPESEAGSDFPQVDAETQSLWTCSELNLRDRVVGEVEKNSFIALPGRGGHSGVTASRLCAPTSRGE